MDPEINAALWWDILLNDRAKRKARTEVFGRDVCNK